MTVEILTWVLLSWYVVPVVLGLTSMLICMAFDLYYHGTVLGKDNKPLVLMLLGVFVPVLNIVIMATTLIVLIQYARDI